MENYWAHKITCIYFTNSVISDNSVCLDMLHLPPKEQLARWKQRFTIRLFGEARVQTQPAGLQTLSKGNLRLQICPSRWRRSAIAILVWTCHCQTVGFFDVDGDWQGHVIRIYKVYWQGYIMLNLFLMFWWCHSEKNKDSLKGTASTHPPLRLRCPFHSHSSWPSFQSNSRQRSLKSSSCNGWSETCPNGVS